MSRAGFVVVSVLTVAAGLFATGEARAQEVNWRTDLTAARKEAVQTGRPLLLDFGFEGCVWCRKLDATTFRAPTVVAALNERFIPVKVDVEQDGEISRAMGIKSFPTLVVATPDGKVVDQHSGYMDVRQLMALLSRVPAAQAKPDPVAMSASESREMLARFRRDYESQNYLACLTKGDELQARFPNSTEAREARTLAGKITGDPDKWQRVLGQIDENLATIGKELAADGGPVRP
ncbi:thioredoxin family protein [Fimbriiglobus ruber]|uniref:Thioredoxin domain-containing protein n=1 Tax=Fimbriiglobus ruber TaxID=1908690 RepID=A0A225DZ60_9BACT|nr:thioredoxin family protein [Fimbriiglobus ruber]OWK46641.1 Thioredoxin domain-containing protein [Fimbriiglobus ruber]